MKNRLLILGGGFGLYGYLPAATETSWEVSTLTRYRNAILGRVELKGILSQVTFVEENKIDIESFDGIVIARDPTRQLDFVKQNSRFHGHFFLEKPIGATLSSSQEILNILQSRKATFSVAYLFPYQSWYKGILSRMSPNFSLSIVWKIPMVEIKSWKNYEQLGGGILSYYGIHLLSLIVELRHEVENLEVDSKPNFFSLRSASSSGSLKFDLLTSDSPSFEVGIVSSKGRFVWRGATPFGMIPTSGLRDPRIPALSEYLSNCSTNNNSVDSILREQKILELRESISKIL